VPRGKPSGGVHQVEQEFAKQHPDVTFWFVGNDTRTGPNHTSLQQALEERLRASGQIDRVHFQPPLPQAELVPLYRSCTVFVLPSHHDVYPNAEQRPLVIDNLNTHSPGPL